MIVVSECCGRVQLLFGVEGLRQRRGQTCFEESSIVEPLMNGKSSHGLLDRNLSIGSNLVLHQLGFP